MSEPAYLLVMAASAERALARLPEKAAAAVVELVAGALVEAPRVVGHPLRQELMGLWAARRGPYQVVYEIDDDARIVSVVRVDHRVDVYRSH
ncbi:MAG: type II toxin-antitoxin system RelE/ParE family toxin [Actinomycetota bacterium]|nr:type II toxin-antitoxin system RelE/ParE family toxin [Actinomycetota bacterium]